MVLTSWINLTPLLSQLLMLSELRPNHCQAIKFVTFGLIGPMIRLLGGSTVILMIVHKFTAPYSSTQNRLNNVRTLLRDSGLGHFYWAEARFYFIHTQNLILSHHYPGKIPLESIDLFLRCQTHSPCLCQH